jgi:serine/threonine-protein kinase
VDLNDAPTQDDRRPGAPRDPAPAGGTPAAGATPEPGGADPTGGVTEPARAPDAAAPDPMVGTRLSHFEVLERVGAGGMGVVYRARDQRLPREVAIKMLPSGALADPDVRARFVLEAQTLARLSHPGIATLFEFDRAGDHDFLVMEFVTGETLEHRLSHGPLDEDTIGELAAQIAEALAAAHEQQVVHRDLKPGNVMVTPRGQVKVLDFGVARFTGPAPDDDASVRTSGVTAVVGTLAYMAPEQMRGAAVDARADLYALGVVLYRMATGRLPFSGAGALALAGQVLHDAPPPPRTLRPDLSLQLSGLILRCLEKDPARRPASAAALAADLRRLRAPAPGGAAEGSAAARPPLRSLVVLPLENLSGDPGQEYFADGMTDTLITNLARIGALRVISRTSAMHYKGTRRQLPEIARELGVEAVVEGTVMRSGDKVRITAQLVDAVADRTLWGFSVEREVRDVLELQGEVARTVAEEIRVLLTPEESARLRAPRTVDPEALELCLRGRFLWNRRAPADMERSIELFRAALEKAPDYAAAWSGLADAWSILGAFRVHAPAEMFEKARAAAEKALELDPELAEAHASLAFALQHHEWDFATSERSFRRAIELNPGYVNARHWFADLLVVQERFDEGLEQALRAKELDPFSPTAGTSLATAYYYMRRYPQALDLLDREAELHPGFVPVHMDRGRVLEELGRLDEAQAAFETGVRVAGGDPAESSALAHLYALRGERARAEAVIGRLQAAAAHRHVSPYTIATIYAGMRDADHAFEWLERAFAGRDPMIIYLRVHPRLDALRGDARLADLQRRVGLTS